MSDYGLGNMLAASGGLADLKEVVTRLGAAALLSGILGLEREIRNKPLGLRTNILVALGACSLAGGGGACSCANALTVPASAIAAIVEVRYLMRGSS